MRLAAEAVSAARVPKTCQAGDKVRELVEARILI